MAEAQRCEEEKKATSQVEVGHIGAGRLAPMVETQLCFLCTMVNEYCKQYR